MRRKDDGKHREEGSKGERYREWGRLRRGGSDESGVGKKSI
jgi:hypothetical protein